MHTLQQSNDTAIVSGCRLSVMNGIFKIRIFRFPHRERELSGLVVAKMNHGVLNRFTRHILLKSTMIYICSGDDCVRKRRGKVWENLRNLYIMSKAERWKVHTEEEGLGHRVSTKHQEVCNVIASLKPTLPINLKKSFSIFEPRKKYKKYLTM